MTREEQLQIDLQEIVARQPAAPQYTLSDLEKDTATAVAWHGSFKTWSDEFDSKIKELEEELNK
jgi:hypothetical protein